MKKLAVIAAIIAMFSLLLAGCRSEVSCYAALLVYEGEEYLGADRLSVSDYPDVVPVGEVEKRVNAEKMPTADNSSNVLEEGTPIYRLDEQTLLAQVDSETYQRFTRRQN